MNEFKNILIVRTDRMGDVVLTTPSIRALRKTYPKAKISILLAPSTRDLIDGNPNIDEILIDDRKKAHRGMGGFVKLVRLLRAKKFDLAILYHTKKRTNLACFLARIPVRMGYKNSKFGFLLTDPIQDIRHHGKQHEVEYCLNLLKHLGIEDDQREVYVSIQEESQQWLKQWLKKNKIAKEGQLIAIHPGASDPSRRWPVNRFAELVTEMNQRYVCKLVLIGNFDIRETTRSIISLVDFPILDLTGMTTISQLASLLKRCTLLISNDSGPVHVASGVGTPVVSIFTRNQPGINPERWRPLGKKSRVVSIPPDDEISFAKAGSVDPKYLELIKTQEVLEAVDSVFKLC